MIARALVVATAREWLGTRWQHQARLKGVACDCAGLVVGVARELGIKEVDFDVNGYQRIPNGNELKEHCRAHMAPVPLENMQPGDVVLMRFAGEPQHLAIVADYVGGGLSIVHAYALSRKVVEARLDDIWHARIVEAYQMPGVE